MQVTRFITAMLGISRRPIPRLLDTKEGRGKFGYFNNYLVDTDHAVIVDVEATPARLAQEIIASKAMLERVEGTHGLKPERLAADKAYGTGPFLSWLSERKITPHIPVLDWQHQTDGLLARDAFIFDCTNNHYICPQGQILKHRTARAENRIHIYRAKASDCKSCGVREPFRVLLFPSTYITLDPFCS